MRCLISASLAAAAFTVCAAIAATTPLEVPLPTDKAVKFIAIYKDTLLGEVAAGTQDPEYAAAFAAIFEEIIKRLLHPTAASTRGKRALFFPHPAILPYNLFSVRLHNNVTRSKRFAPWHYFGPMPLVSSLLAMRAAEEKKATAAGLPVKLSGDLRQKREISAQAESALDRRKRFVHFIIPLVASIVVPTIIDSEAKKARARDHAAAASKERVLKRKLMELSTRLELVQAMKVRQQRLTL